MPEPPLPEHMPSLPPLPPPIIPHEYRVLQELVQVHGIGSVKAKELYNLGVSSLSDLEQKVESGQIRLTHAQTIGLKHYQDFAKKIPRAEVERIGNYILYVIREGNPNNVADIVGSYRRGKEESGDVDILMSNITNTNDLAAIIKYLQEKNVIYDVLSLGEVKFQGTYWSNAPDPTGILRKIDIRWVPIQDYTTSLLHATGSGQFNVYLRQRALDMGMTLSEHGLYEYSGGRKGNRIETPTEADVFKQLGLDYIEPKDRNY